MNNIHTAEEKYALSNFITTTMSKKIPIVIQTDQDYLPKLHQMFGEYCREVDKVRFFQNKKALIREVCGKLESAVEYYYNGLVDLFQLTSPICMNEIFALSDRHCRTVGKDGGEECEGYRLDTCYVNQKSRDTPIKVGLDRITEYENTRFFEIEELLHSFKPRRLEEL